MCQNFEKSDNKRETLILLYPVDQAIPDLRAGVSLIFI
jgi:hypothetical protein